MEGGRWFCGTLSSPFPHTAAWNDLPAQPAESDDEEKYEKALHAFDAIYWNPANVNGAIPLCHEGCAYRYWLIVTGREAGHMWYDARTTQAGLQPIAIGRKKRVTFLEWYTHWLDEALEKLPKARD